MSSDQMGFDLVGIDKPMPRPSAQNGRFKGDNLFIAARPDRAAATAARAIAHDCRDLYRIDRQPLTEQRLHVSLIGVDRAPVLGRGLISDARQAIDATHFEPFEISLDCLMSFRADASRPIVLAASKANPALRSLLLRLADRLDGLGVPCGFDPEALVHMTLVYYDRQIVPERLATPVSWVVDQLWLIKSLVGRGSYDFLWPTEKPPDA
ncbi:2'-5' RNA ligase family protein [Rhizobium sp.]